MKLRIVLTLFALVGGAVPCSGGGLPNTMFGSGAGVNNVPFASIATSGSASDLTKGTLPSARLPAFAAGDVTSSAGSAVLTLGTVNASPGSYGSASSVPNITVNAKGLVTAASSAAVVAPAGTVTGTLATSAEPAHTGDMTNAAGSLATTVGKIGGQPIVLGGGFNTSGAFSITLTATGSTSLTLPPSGTVTALGNTTTGTGAIVLGTSPSLVTPNLGTPSAAVLSNATGLSLTTGVSGVLPSASGGTGVASLSGLRKANGASADTAATSSDVASVLALPPGLFIGRQVFATPGTFTYTPTTGTTFVDVQCVGAGGAGGGSVITGAGQTSIGGSAPSGAYARKKITSGFTGAAVVIGAGGTGTQGGSGSAGGASSFGSAITVTGGPGAGAGAAVTPPAITAAGSNPTISTGVDVAIQGGSAAAALALLTTAISSSPGGSTPAGFGFGGGAKSTLTGANGVPAIGYGSGGSGAASTASQGAFTGGAGAGGLCIVDEFR